MKFATAILCIVVAICFFMLLRDDSAQLDCQAAGHAADTCSMAINP